MIRTASLLILLPATLWGADRIETRPDVPPRPIHQPAPAYPEELKARRITGGAELRVVIDERGDVKDIMVEAATNEEFGRSAAAAVAQWRYEPALKGGQPCAIRAALPVGFGLSATDLAELEARRVKEALPSGPPLHPMEELDEWPVLKKEIKPETPGILRTEKRMGQAVMALIVDETGSPRDVHPLLNTHTECAAAATEAIRQWRFRPGRRGGTAVRTALEVTMVFFPESQAASGLRVRPGVRVGDDGATRLPADQREARPLKEASRPPRVTRQSPPEYPAEMSARAQGGRAVIEFVIDTRGRVTHVRTVQQTNAFFAAMAERAVSKWEFQPAEHDGHPVACRVSQLIEFRLSY